MSGVRPAAMARRMGQFVTSSRTRLLPLPFDSVPVTHDPAHFGGAEHVGAAVGLLVETDDVDDPERVDLAGDQVRGRPDQGVVLVGDLAADERHQDLAGGARSPR